MPSLTEVRIAVTNGHGKTVGHVIISLLPRGRNDVIPALLLDESGEIDRDPVLHPVQLLEGNEYRFEFQLDDPGDSIGTDLPEVFQPDTRTGITGRLRTGMLTGALSVRVLVDDRFVGEFAVEVRSRKLNYLSQYRWMLRDLAEDMSGLILERFAPTQQRFTVDDTADATTLYQRFCFLRSLFESDSFLNAIQYIIARPYLAWVEEPEERRIGSGIRASSSVAREIQKVGPRTPWLSHSHPLGLTSVPRSIIVTRAEETLDNTPNRFLQFVLTRWRSEVSHIQAVLSAEPLNAPVRRGLNEVAAAIDFLDRFLAADLFRNVSALTYFPSGNQVLLRRGGYREVFHSFLQSELAARLSWDGGEQVYGAGQKNVAALYEYWVFLQLAKIVSSLSEQALDLGSLLEITNNGLNLSLKRGRHRVLLGQAERLGRKIRIEFWFNRQFARDTHSTGSWSHSMRPDYSLLLSPASDENSTFEPIWLHFDAKYRIDGLRQVFGDDIDSNGAAVGDIEGKPLRADLLKMHTYRDAIRRSAGAYILYPGSETASLREYHEILPGLGAFALRPTEGGDAQGTRAIATFIDDVLTHVASQFSQHERGRYWRRQSYSRRVPETIARPAAPFLMRPPADTAVLLAYVRNFKHLEWIQSNCLYNLRADHRTGSVGLDAPETAVEFIALYGPSMNYVSIWRVSGEPQLATSADMLRRSYPNPRGSLYYCLPIEPVRDNRWTNVIPVSRFDPLLVSLRRGTPRTIRWDELMREAYPHSDD